MSWSQILPSLVILSIFTFELHVIELFLPNSVLMRYFRRWPSSCHVSSGRHIGWIRPNWILPNSVWCDISVGGHPGVTSVQGSILAEYDQIKNHVLTWNPAKFLHIRGIRDWDIASKLRFDAIYPSVAILVSRQFRVAYWLITTKTLGEEETFLTQSFSFLKERKIMYHSQYMWKSCSEPTPYGPHFGWRGVTSVQGGISADYNQIDTHCLKYKPAKFGFTKSLHMRATRDWAIPSKLRFDAIYPSVAILT